MGNCRDAGSGSGSLSMGLMERGMPSNLEGRALHAPHRHTGAGVVNPEEAVLETAASERTAKEDGWIKTSVTDAEAARMLRGAGSGVRPLLDRHGYRTAKRAFDIVASGAAIAVLLVPGLVLSAAICIKSPGAGPLYSQLRVGRVRKNGTYRLFRMWKFRSMVPHADEMLKELQNRNEADGPLFKIKDDPRVIPGIGTFIRKHSIDELPQLLNVFVGQMSPINTAARPRCQRNNPVRRARCHAAASRCRAVGVSGRCRRDRTLIRGDGRSGSTSRRVSPTTSA